MAALVAIHWEKGKLLVMADKERPEFIRSSREDGVSRFGRMAFDEAHQAVPMGKGKLEHMETLRRDYCDKPKSGQ
ncbi:hypothetical protein [Alcanivorax sp. 1008]|uniref:hypothetical protein n=1 Tax=Alcanivorax sp. 1008 TaxID=2816853 RepID=UPI001D1C9058|nr:hypothetical protein [Alcanivorax sp. 1008]MCC1496904.1 hypothetical protein [Alcanivorax sp. 1008]